jgi:hypothetical protein
VAHAPDALAWHRYRSGVEEVKERCYAHFPPNYREYAHQS